MRSISGAELDAVVADYHRNGFAYLREFFTPQDLAGLEAALEASGSSPGGFSVSDSLGGKQELSVWMELGDDLIGVIPRLERMVSVASAVLDDEVCHWHSKLSWKRPGSNSLWDWHQDYGFWADEGVARPDMCTIAIALGPIDASNGCMRLVRGSHQLGKIAVVSVGQGQGADPAVVEAAMQTSNVEICELNHGDAVVFHANTLHASGPNTSDRPRTMLMSSYNAFGNPPTEPMAAGRPLDRLKPVADKALLNPQVDVFGQSAFIAPNESGLDYGYTIGQPVDP